MLGARWWQAAGNWICPRVVGMALVVILFALTVAVVVAAAVVGVVCWLIGQKFNRSVDRLWL